MVARAPSITGTTLKQMRRRKRISRAALSRASGISYRNLMRFEAGQTTLATDDLLLLEAALNNQAPTAKAAPEPSPAVEPAPAVKEESVLHLHGAWQLDPQSGALAPAKKDSWLQVVTRPASTAD